MSQVSQLRIQAPKAPPFQKPPYGDCARKRTNPSPQIPPKPFPEARVDKQQENNKNKWLKMKCMSTEGWKHFAKDYTEFVHSIKMDGAG